MLATNETSLLPQRGGHVRGALRARSLLGIYALMIGLSAMGGGRADEPAAKSSPLDKLDPATIPAAERFDKQPKELVAVLGKRSDSGDAWNGVAFSPDGKWLASCRDDEGGRVVILWDTATTREAAVLRGHKRPVRSVAFSPDGKTLASGAGQSPEEGEVKLWDLGGKEPKLKAELAGHRDIVLSVAFSPDGKTLASVSSDKEVRLWDLSGEKPVEKVKLQTPRPGADAVAFSPDGKLLATTDVLWGLGGAKPEKRAALYPSVYKGSGGSCVAFSPDGKSLAVGAGNDRTVLVWQLGGAELKEPLELKDAGDPVLAVAMAPDSRRLASSATDGLVILWGIDGKKLQEWKLPHLAVNSVAFAPDGRHLAAANEKGLVYILRLPK